MDFDQPQDTSTAIGSMIPFGQSPKKYFFYLCWH